MLLRTGGRLRRVERAAVHIDDDIVLAGTEIGVDVDDLTGCVKGAAVERHDRRAVRPEGIVAIRGVERRVLEHSGLIAPVERLAFNDAVIDNGVVDADETKVVRLIGVQRHVFECNGLGSVKRIIAVVFRSKVFGFGEFSANAPSRVFAGADKSEALAISELALVFYISSVITRTELNGVVVICLFNSDSQVVIRLVLGGVCNRAGSNRSGSVVCKSRRCNAHRDERNGKQRCDRTRGRFQK